MVRINLCKCTVQFHSKPVYFSNLILDKTVTPPKLSTIIVDHLNYYHTEISSVVDPGVSGENCCSTVVPLGCLYFFLCSAIVAFSEKSLAKQWISHHRSFFKESNEAACSLFTNVWSKKVLSCFFIS